MWRRSSEARLKGKGRGKRGWRKVEEEREGGRKTERGQEGEEGGEEEEEGGNGD